MSSVMDEDTARAIQTGRAAAGEMLATARDDLRKVFIVFVVGLMGTILLLRAFVWDFLRENTKSRMSSAVAANVDIIVRTPFDVILLQVKIGLFVGVALAIPLLLYYSRDALRRRGVDSVVPVSRWKLAAFVSVSSVLASLGVAYAYAVFFPFMFDFLATNAISADIKPSYDIVLYVQFLLLLTVSFGIAAQLPLLMSALAYTEVVPYEFFRDKWRYAVLGIFVFGAIASPPEPFTQIMWGIPLVSLYMFSLGLAKLVTNIRRRGESDTGGPVMKRALLALSGVFVAGGVAAWAFVEYGGFAFLNEEVWPTISRIPYFAPNPASLESTVGFSGVVGELLFSVYGGGIAVFFALLVAVVQVLRKPVVPREIDAGTGGSPEDIDVGELDAGGVRAAPIEAFVAMDEDEAVALAQEAIDEGNKQKAQAILDRFDEAEEAVEAEEDDGEGEATAAEDEESDVFTSTAAGMADAFTEDETTEDDIGGYYYDIRFVLESLTSKMFRLVGLFMLVIGASFYWLYQGGLRILKAQFLGRLGENTLAALRPSPVPEGYTVALGPRMDPSHTRSPAYRPKRLLELAETELPDFVVALHPVEHIIFEIKISLILAVIVTLPLALYYAWPAMRSRGIVTTGNRNVFLVWGASLILGVLGGTVFGFFYVAPAVISYLVHDAIDAGIVISYRLKSFMWLVLYTTAGLGILAEIPVTMVLFDRAGIVPYETMQRYWQEFVFVVFVGVALLTPAGVLLMFLTAVPIALAYGVGLVVLWLLTFPRRVRRDGMGGVFPS